MLLAKEIRGGSRERGHALFTSLGKPPKSVECNQAKPGTISTAKTKYSRQLLSSGRRWLLSSLSTKLSDQLEADAIWKTWLAAMAGTECVTSLSFRIRIDNVPNADWDWLREKRNQDRWKYVPEVIDLCLCLLILSPSRK